RVVRLAWVLPAACSRRSAIPARALSNAAVRCRSKAAGSSRCWSASCRLITTLTSPCWTPSCRSPARRQRAAAGRATAPPPARRAPRRDDPRPGGDELGAVGGVADGGADQLGEPGEAILRPHRQRNPLVGAGDQRPPAEP